MISFIFRLNQLIAVQINALFEPWLVPLAARFAFAAVLMNYYWASALTKIGDTILQPSTGAYYQIFPAATEAVAYDVSQLSGFHTSIVLLGTYAEFILPALIVFGLFTRIAAIGMIGFIVVQSLTDIFGHGVDAQTIGALFDRASDSAILDQRLMWVTILLIIFARGPGGLSLDKLFGTEIHIDDI